MQVLDLLYKSIDIFESQYDQYDTIEKSLDTALFGKNGVLDSLGLVSFLLIVEQEIVDGLGIEITIADEKAMSLKNSPFRNINSLKNYLETLV
tara:strand:- start:4123 stop:4401 length:279 start_codon:yes stop_codon:yes gene_type:complete